MELADLLRETLDVDCDEVWENERTPTPVRVFGVRLHSIGLSVREVVVVFELLGIDCSHGAIWNWTHTLSEPRVTRRRRRRRGSRSTRNRLRSTVSKSDFTQPSTQT